MSSINNYDSSLGDDLLDVDPVVNETDVFVNSTQYDNTMTLMTLPTTPCTRPRPLHDKADGGRWQREQKAFKFELKKAPSQVPMALGSDDVSNFKRALVSRRVPLAANYAVGVVSASGDLHLTPCNVAVDLLQDLSHIDERNLVDRLKKEQEARDEATEMEEILARDADGNLTIGRGIGGIDSASSMAVSMHEKATQAANAASAAAAASTTTTTNNNNNNNNDDQNNAASTTAASTTTTAAAGEQAKPIREHTYEHMVNTASLESWRPLDVSHRLDASALECSQPFQRYDCEHIVPATDIDWYEQASRLLPGTRRSDAWTRPGASQQARSQAALSRLSLVQQVAQIMRQEQTLPFSTIAEKATRVVDDGGLLDALKHVAVMVRGRWIAKSNLVCGGNQVLEAARNYILYMFATANVDADDVNLARNEEPGVAVQDMADQTTLLVERVFGLVETFAKRRAPGSNVFVLRIDRDRDFLSRHPRVAEMYDESWWTSMREELVSAITQVVKGQPSEIEKNVHYELGVRHDALFELEHDDLGGNSAQEQLRKFLIAMFTHFGVCSLALLETTLEALKMEANLAPLITADQVWSDEMAAVLQVEAIEVQPRIFCRKQLGNDKIDPYRDVIIQLFKNKPELKRSEIFEGLRVHKKKGDAEGVDQKEPEPKEKEMDLTQIPTTMYTRICRELAESRGAKWILKHGNGVSD
jgi:hypothetical protein